MATSSTILCGICETRQITKCAEHWCPECKEGLCSDCHDHHSSGKGTRKHQIVTSLVSKIREEKKTQIATVVNKVAPKSICNIKLELLSTFTIPKQKDHIAIAGCTICPDGKMIFTDCENNRLVFINADGTPDKVIHKIRKPYDVTAIDPQTVAVAGKSGIKIIDVNSKKIEKTKTEQTCYGITYYKDSLLWCEEHQGVKRMSLKDRSVSTLLKADLPPNCFLGTFDNKIYFTHEEKKSVECYSMEGQQEWEFNDISILPSPFFVTVDSNMFVYTTSWAEVNHVVVISPDGKQGRQLFSSRDGIDLPRGICFDRIRNNLLFVDTTGRASLYHVNYM